MPVVLTVDPRSGVPIYLQVIEQVKRSVAIGKIIDAVARDDLPHTTGFFFGASDGTEKDETLRIFNAALTWLRTEEHMVFRSIRYRASW